MTQALIAGQPIWFPAPGTLTQATANGYATDVIDASTEKFAWVGWVFNKDYASKTLTKVHFRVGTVSVNAASVIRISTQDVSTAAGAPMQPDGTQDQTVDLAGSAFSSGGWISATLGATRSVTFLEALAIVIEYQSFTAADSIQLANAQNSDLAGMSGTVLNTGTWAARNGSPSILLEFDDGTFGTFLGGLPSTARGTSSGNFNTGTALTEAGLRFQMPFPCTIQGAWFLIDNGASTADFDVVLYDAATHTSRASRTMSARRLVGVPRVAFTPFASGYAIPANTDYDMVVKPTTANNLSIRYDEVASAAHLQAWPGGSTHHYVTKTSGVWAATTTRRPICGLLISAADDATGASAFKNFYPGQR